MEGLMEKSMNYKIISINGKVVKLGILFYDTI